MLGVLRRMVSVLTWFVSSLPLADPTVGLVAGDPKLNKISMSYKNGIQSRYEGSLI